MLSKDDTRGPVWKLAGTERKWHNPPVDVTILNIGTELVRGEILNTNARDLSEKLTHRGQRVIEQTVVEDEPCAIAAALRRALAQSQIVITTGGLGPTTDDITTETIAQALSLDLWVHEPSLARIRERLRAYGRELSESNQKQARVPVGATVLFNDWGMAPGYHLITEGKHLVVLPGVPSELGPMFETRAIPLLPLADQNWHRVVLRTFGMPESQLNDHLHGVAERFGVTLGYRVDTPEIWLKVEGRESLACAAAADEIRARLGTVVFGGAETTLAQAVGEALLARGWCLGLAESCTGGLISQSVTDVPGASRWFRGGVVAYDNAVKRELLGVAAELLTAHGAVSREVACAMALGARRLLKCDIAAAITGIAGPEGGTKDKPVGTVEIAVAVGDTCTAVLHRLAGNRATIRRRGTYLVLARLREHLLESPKA